MVACCRCGVRVSWGRAGRRGRGQPPCCVTMSHHAEASQAPLAQPPGLYRVQAAACDCSARSGSRSFFAS
eukprot:4653974-Alexandrium_andersonii.AAC.1